MISVILPELWYHLRIWNLRQFVIFHDITGFERHGLLRIISFIAYWWVKISYKRKMQRLGNHAQFNYGGFVGFVID